MSDSNLETLVNLVKSSQDIDFATNALADWYTARYDDGIKIINDIMTVATDESTGSEWTTKLNEFLSTHDNMLLAMDDGNVIQVPYGTLLTTIHNEEDDEDVITYDGLAYKASDLLTRFTDSVNSLAINSSLIKTMLNDNIENVTDRAQSFYNDISMKLGGLTEAGAAYANSMFQAIQSTPSESRYDAINAIRNWLGLNKTVTTAFAPDFNGVETSGVSSYTAAANSMKAFGDSILQGLKKVGNAINGFFGNIFTKAARAVVSTVQTVTGLRDAFGCNEAGSLYFMDYGRNFKILRSEVTYVLGNEDWDEHVTPNRYYQFQLPAGLGVVWVDSEDSEYVNCSIYTRPINKATFINFFNPTLANSQWNSAYMPSFALKSLENDAYVDILGVRWFNPHGVYKSYSVVDGPKCFGYYAIPADNTRTVSYWISKFDEVTKSDISGAADWLATDNDMWFSLRAANIINYCYLLLNIKLTDNSTTSDSTMVWSDPESDYFYFNFLETPYLIDAMYDGNSFNTTGNGQWYMRDKSMNVNDYLTVDIHNSDLALLLTGSNTARVNVTSITRTLSGTYWDYLICPTLYVLFCQNEFAAYVNSTSLPAAKYYILSDSQLAKNLGFAIAGASAVGAVIIGIFAAVKFRKIARTVKASIAAKERQLTTALATLGNGWTPSNWASARDAYGSINKLNKWATLADSISSSIYGSFTAIPSFLAGRLSSATSKITSQVSSLLSSGKSLDSTQTAVGKTVDLSKVDELLEKVEILISGY